MSGEHVGRGYVGFSKSVNAEIAESEGKMNATQLAKALGVSSKEIRDGLRPCSYHHTSKFYNEVNYYDEPLLIEVAAALKSAVRWSRWRESFTHGCKSEIREALEFLKQLRDASRQIEVERKVIGNFKWIKWSGTRRRPVANEVKFENVPATLKGKYAFVETPGGVVKKLMSGNHFEMTIISEAEVTCGQA
jgi:hypothetical protein